jgi:hypothetical protein
MRTQVRRLLAHERLRKVTVVAGYQSGEVCGGCVCETLPAEAWSSIAPIPELRTHLAIRGLGPLILGEIKRFPR